MVLETQRLLANKSTSGAVLNVNGGNASAAYHLYGGTYRKLAEDTQAPIVHICTNGGTATVHDGAVIDNRNAGCAGLHVYSGTITGNVTLTNGAAFSAGGGTINGTVTAAPRS